MWSAAAICTAPRFIRKIFLRGRKLVRQYDARLAEEFEKCNRILISYKRECETYRVYENIGSFLFALMRLAAGMDEFLQKRTDFAERKEVTEFYLKLRNFITILRMGGRAVCDLHRAYRRRQISDEALLRRIPFP